MQRIRDTSGARNYFIVQGRKFHIIFLDNIAGMESKGDEGLVVDGDFVKSVLIPAKNS
jgi:hypothetical protein